MTSLYEISYNGIEQHITLTQPAWLGEIWKISKSLIIGYTIKSYNETS